MVGYKKAFKGAHVVLKISKKIDYGLMAISHMACRKDDKTVSTKRIAEEYRIPTELLAKILQKMARGGLITSLNGPKGGYVLARAPKDITVGEVIKAIEGPIDLVDCFKSGENNCDQIGNCSIRTPIRHIQDSISRMLDSISIEQITQVP